MNSDEITFRTLVDHATDIITILDADGTIRYGSPAIRQILGYDPDELIGSNAFSLVHSDDVTANIGLFTTFATARGSSESASFRFRHHDGSWRWLEVTGTNLLDDPSVRGIVVNSRDVTERRQREEFTRALLVETQRQAQELALLSEVRTALALELELPALFRTVVEAVASTLGYTLVGLYLLVDDALVLQHHVGYDTVVNRIPLTEGIVGRVVRTGKPILLEDVRTDPAFIAVIPGLVSEVCVPLRDGDRVVGALNLESRAGVQLTHADLLLMLALSEHVNLAISRARLYTEVRRDQVRFRALVQNAADMISVLDEDGRHTYASPAYAQVLGYRPEQLMGQSIDVTCHPDDIALNRRLLATLGQTPDTLERFETRARHRDGSTRWLEVIAVNQLAIPEVAGIVITSRDITERKAADAERLRRSRHATLRADVGAALAEPQATPVMLQRCAEALVSHLDAAVAQIWLVNQETRELELQASAGQNAGTSGPESPELAAGAAIHRVVQECRPLLTNDLADDPPIVSAPAGHAGSHAFAGYPLRADGKVAGAVAMFTCQPLPNDTLEALGMTVDSIGHGLERQAFEARLWHEAHYDPLTGLPNRTLFDKHLDGALAQAPLHRPGNGIAILFLDLDDFKVVNDSLGHDVGDRLLKAAAQRLTSNLRAEDMIARYGGDEFAIAISEATDQETALQIAARLLATLKVPFGLDGREVVVSASVGIVVVGELTERADLLRAVDVALYRAKAAGKGAATVFDPAADDAALVRLHREMALRHGLERGEMRIFYQPIVQLATGAVVGVEALVRWAHPQRGLVMPEEFIPLAEETGLIVPLGRWLRTEACCQVRTWQASFPALDPLQLSVNLSPREMRQADLIETLRHLLETSGLSPRSLTLEITESIAITEAEESARTMRAIKALGVRFALDDFGTGYASLSALRQHPINELKLDRSFVVGLGHSHEDTAIVRATIWVAKSLGLRVTAEGVETSEHLALLQELGCEQGQGYVFAPPLPAAELEVLLTKG